MRPPQHILEYGRSALLLEWRQEIAPDINHAVHAYARAAAQLPAVQEVVPAYCSLLITFSPQLISAYALKEQLYELKPTSLTANDKLHRLPVCYGGVFGPDLIAVAEKLSLSPQRVIELHHQVEYRVYQMGYQPGFAFMGITAPELAINRRENPRTKVPAGSLGLAGRQSGIYPQEAPGGWQIIGRCPWPLLRTEPAPYFRLKAGDRVQFFPIAATAWEEYQTKAAAWTD